MATLLDQDSETDGLTGNDVMDGILRHSEQSMLSAIARLGQHVDTLGAPIPAQKRKPGNRYGYVCTAEVERPELTVAEVLRP